MCAVAHEMKRRRQTGLVLGRYFSLPSSYSLCFARVYEKREGVREMKLCCRAALRDPELKE